MTKYLNEKKITSRMEISKGRIIDPSEACKINYNSKSSKRELKKIIKSNKELLKYKIPNTEEMYLRYNI